ncbi:MAG: hypothetical protein WC847_03040 [Candidatus Paceibacterota bacterium]|jgi:hypothetical protein
MTKQKIIIGIFIAIIILILVFIAFRTNRKVPKEVNTTKTEDVVITPTENPTIKQTEFGELVSLKLNDSVTFSDGLNIVLKEINDSRCPKGVECIWAGEISGSFALSGAALSSPGEFRLGSLNKKSVVLDGYTFSLKNATENTLNIEVLKN